MIGNERRSSCRSSSATNATLSPAGDQNRTPSSVTLRDSKGVANDSPQCPDRPDGVHVRDANGQQRVLPLSPSRASRPQGVPPMAQLPPTLPIPPQLLQGGQGAPPSGPTVDHIALEGDPSDAPDSQSTRCTT